MSENPIRRRASKFICVADLDAALSHASSWELKHELSSASTSCSKKRLAQEKKKREAEEKSLTNPLTVISGESTHISGRNGSRAGKR